MPTVHLLTLLNLARISKCRQRLVSSTPDLRCHKPHYGTSLLLGEVITPARMMTSSSEEHVPLPSEVNISRERLPDVLDVYDKDASALLRITISRVYNVYHRNAKLIIPVGDPSREAEYRSWEKFLARNPVKFVRKYPVHDSTTLKDEDLLILHLHRPLMSRGCRKPPQPCTNAQLASSISANDEISAPATTQRFFLLHSPSRPMRSHPLNAVKLPSK